MCMQQTQQLKQMVERLLVVGMATDGIDCVPIDGTYVLAKGERVSVTPSVPKRIDLPANP